MGLTVGCTGPQVPATDAEVLAATSAVVTTRNAVPTTDTTPTPTATPTSIGEGADSPTSEPEAPSAIDVGSPLPPGSFRYLHPFLGELVIAIVGSPVEDPAAWVVPRVVATQVPTGQVVFEWESDVEFDYFWPLGMSVGDSAPAPVDQLGHIFVQWSPGRFNGISVLVPTDSGFDTLGTFGDGYGGFYNAFAADRDGDGAYEIEITDQECEPSCADGKYSTSLLRWNGSSYTETSRPEAEMTLPSEDFFSMPQLGIEPVRGSGCGLSTSLGDSLPDGWWIGFVENMTADQIVFDLVCVYFGEEAIRMADECYVATGDESCGVWDNDFYVVNTNERLREISLQPGFAQDLAPQWCTLDVLSNDGFGPTWIHIAQGTADHVWISCAGG